MLVTWWWLAWILAASSSFVSGGDSAKSLWYLPLIDRQSSTLSTWGATDPLRTETVEGHALLRQSGASPSTTQTYSIRGLGLPYLNSGEALDGFKVVTDLSDRPRENRLSYDSSLTPPNFHSQPHLWTPVPWILSGGSPMRETFPALTGTTSKRRRVTWRGKVIIDPSYSLGCETEGIFPISGQEMLICSSQYLLCQQGRLGFHGLTFRCPPNFAYHEPTASTRGKCQLVSSIKGCALESAGSG